MATRAPARAEARLGASSRPDLATAALALLMAAGAILLLYAGRRLTFFYDEWTFITIRRGAGISTYLDPHNGHLSLFPVLIYKALFATVGLRSYLPYRVVGIALHLICAWLLYVLARRRIGPLAALVPTFLLLFLGGAWQDLLWPFQIGYLGSVAGGLGALALLDVPERRRSGWASALLALSLASSSVGIAFLFAAAALLLVQRAPLREFWVVAVPAVLYVIWYIGWGGGEQTSTSAILAAPQFVADAAGGAVAGIVGLVSGGWGPPLAVALIAVCAVVWMRRQVRSPTPMLLAALTGGLVFWILTAVVRAGVSGPTESRYLYIGAVFILLIVAEVAAGLSLRSPWLLGGALVALLGVFVVNIGLLRGGEGALRSSTDSVRPSLAAVQIAAAVVSPAFAPDPVNAPQLTAGNYLAAVRDLGSPAPSVAELTQEPEAQRARADIVLANAEGVANHPASGLASAGLRNEAVFGATTLQRGDCEEIVPRGSITSVDLLAPVGTALHVRQPAGGSATVYVRRFASGFAPPAITTLAGGSALTLAFPRDRAPRVPWHVQVVGGRFTVCG